ncbi:hypothetical protein M9Y30_19340, partial [Providencia thailandensis]
NILLTKRIKYYTLIFIVRMQHTMVSKIKGWTFMFSLRGYALYFYIFSILFFIAPLVYVIINEDKNNLLTFLSSLTIIFYVIVCMAIFF